jgi:hypothetical protein
MADLAEQNRIRVHVHILDSGRRVMRQVIVRAALAAAAVLAVGSIQASEFVQRFIDWW